MAAIRCSDEASDEQGFVRHPEQGDDGDHHHDVAEEGHPALLDERTKTACHGRRAGDRAGFHATLRAGAGGFGHAGKLGVADLNARGHRGDAGGRDCGCRCDGGAERRHFRRHSVRADEKTRRGGTRDRRRAARPRRRAHQRAAGVVRGRRRAGLGERIDLRRLAAADRLRWLCGISRRRDRGRRRRSSRHSAGHGGIRGA